MRPKDWLKAGARVLFPPGFENPEAGAAGGKDESAVAALVPGWGSGKRLDLPWVKDCWCCGKREAVPLNS